MNDWRDIEPRLSGRWFEILEAFGIETRKLNKNGPCPNCGGVDRAHFFERDGRVLLYCRHGCGNSGEGRCVSTPEFLLQEHNRWSFPEMVRAVADYLGTTPADKVQHSSRHAKSAPTYPSSHKSNPEKAASDLSRAIEADDHPLFRREHTASFYAVQTLANCLALPLVNVHGEIVNVAAIAPDYRVFWSAGGHSFGAWAVIQAREPGPRILCADYFDGWRLWWKMRGQCEVRCTISPDVFIWMTRKMRSVFDLVAVPLEDVAEYDEFGLEVVALPEV